MSYGTVESIEQSLAKLIYSESFDNVSVKQIVLDSGLNRQTFYYHFQDKYDCLQYYFDEVAQNLMTGIDQSDWQEYYLKLSRYIDLNKTFFQHIVDSKAYNEFSDFVLEAIDLMVKNLEKSFLTSPKVKKTPRESSQKIFEFGLQGIIVNWFNDGLRENPDLLVKGTLSLGDEQLLLLLGIENQTNEFRQYNEVV